MFASLSVNQVYEGGGAFIQEPKPALDNNELMRDFSSESGFVFVCVHESGCSKSYLEVL